MDEDDIDFQVSKLDAARRQMETAIRLYFSEADPVSIHTLTSAAYELLSDINRAKGGSPMLKEQAPTWVRPDAKDEAKRSLNKAMNFFKHADRDTNGVLDFSLGPTQLLLYDACRKYRELTGETVPLLAVFDIWYGIGPGADLVTGSERLKMQADLRQIFPNATRSSFFAKALPLFSSVKLGMGRKVYP